MVVLWSSLFVHTQTVVVISSRQIYRAPAAVRHPKSSEKLGFLMRYRRSNLSKISKTVTVCKSDDSLCTVDAVFSNWCRPTFGVCAQCGTLLSPWKWTSTVVPCRRRRMPNMAYQWDFHKILKNTLSPKILQKFITRLFMDGFRCGLKFSNQLGELR